VRRQARLLVASAWVALAGGLGLAGCAGGDRTGADRDAIDARPAFEVLSGEGVAIDGATLTSRAASVDVAPRSNMVDWENPAVRLVVERPGPGAGAGPGATWSVTRTIERNGVSSDDGRQLMVLTPEGASAIAEDRNPAEKVDVVFDPPMIVVPGELSRGEERAQKLKVRVYPPGQRGKPRFEGAGQNTIAYTGDELVRTPAGEFAARKVVARFSTKLGPSSIVNVTELWFVDGVGIVAEKREERTSVLGVQVRRNVERWALADAPGSAEQEPPHRRLRRGS
jgi:hypothetical protein